MPLAPSDVRLLVRQQPGSLTPQDRAPLILSVPMGDAAEATEAPPPQPVTRRTSWAPTLPQPEASTPRTTVSRWSREGHSRFAKASSTSPAPNPAESTGTTW